MAQRGKWQKKCRWFLDYFCLRASLAAGDVQKWLKVHIEGWSELCYLISHNVHYVKSHIPRSSQGSGLKTGSFPNGACIRSGICHHIKQLAFLWGFWRFM
jgi:hypothetical protein